MRYDNENDLARNFGGAVVKYKGLIYKVIVDGLRLTLYPWNNSNRWLDVNKKTIDATKEFSFEPMDYGFTPNTIGGVLVWFTKDSKRQFIQGLTPNTTDVAQIGVNQGTVTAHALPLGRNWEIAGTAFWSLVCDAYKPYATIVKNFAGSGALSPAYAITDKNLITVSDVIGRVVTSRTVKIKPEFYNSFLVEDLKLCGVENIRVGDFNNGEEMDV